MNKKSFAYPAIFYPDEGWCSVFFPDLPGCLTCGENAEQAYEMAKEALEGWLEVHLEQVPAAPKATALQRVQKNLEEGEYSGMEIRAATGFVMLVEANLLRREGKKVVKVNASIPTWMKKEASNRGLNISRVLQDALIKEFGT